MTEKCIKCGKDACYTNRIAFPMPFPGSNKDPKEAKTVVAQTLMDAHTCGECQVKLLEFLEKIEQPNRQETK